jgi:hypothetical protein
MSLDACTPWEVWQEYEAQKRALSEAAASSEAYVAGLALIAFRLGCGVPSDELSDAQRHAQERALKRWNGERCAS